MSGRHCPCWFYLFGWRIKRVKFKILPAPAIATKLDALAFTSDFTIEGWLIELNELAFELDVVLIWIVEL